MCHGQDTLLDWQLIYVLTCQATVSHGPLSVCVYWVAQLGTIAGSDKQCRAHEICKCKISDGNFYFYTSANCMPSLVGVVDNSNVTLTGVQVAIEKYLTCSDFHANELTVVI